MPESKSHSNPSLSPHLHSIQQVLPVLSSKYIELTTSQKHITSTIAQAIYCLLPVLFQWPPTLSSSTTVAGAILKILRSWPTDTHTHTYLNLPEASCDIQNKIKTARQGLQGLPKFLLPVSATSRPNTMPVSLSWSQGGSSKWPMNMLSGFLPQNLCLHCSFSLILSSRSLHESFLHLEAFPLTILS